MDKKEFIARRLARCFRPGEVVNLGTGIPELALAYTDPGVLLESDTGMLGIAAFASDPPQTCAHYFNCSCQAVLPAFGGCAFDTALCFGLTRTGHVDTAAVGALQVAANGDLANWAVPGRYFGMGGAMELTEGAKQVIVAMEHCSKHGVPKIVEECTLPCTAYRCVSLIITELCVMAVTEEGLLLTELAPGVTVETVQDKTDAHFRVSPALKVMEL